MKKLLAALSGTVALAAAPAAAQNGFSFIDAGKTAIDYRVATVGPQRVCAELARLSGRDLTILSAELVAASDSAPAKFACKKSAVSGPQAA